jgi:hypothetical protein
MSAIQFKNQYVMELSTDCTAVATTLTLKSGHGDLGCPAIETGQEKHFFITLVNSGGSREIIKVIKRPAGSDVVTIGSSVADQTSGNVSGRAQEGTSALAVTAVSDHALGLRLTAGIMQGITDWINSPSADAIAEKTTAAGVTIDGVLCKDSQVNTDQINEKTTAAGVTIDGVLCKDSQVNTDQINEKTTAAGVTIDGVLCKDGSLVFGGVAQGKDVTSALHRKIVEIGDWDMDTTATKAVPHGLTVTKIRGLSGVIRIDGDNAYYPLTPGSASYDYEPGAIIISADATNINLARKTSTYFDGANFNSTSYNRGWIIVDYVD